MQTLFHENPYRQRIANGHSCMVRVHTKPEYQMMTPDIGHSKKLMILDYLWRYPPYITLLIMVDLVSVSYPPVFLIPRSMVGVKLLKSSNSQLPTVISTSNKAQGVHISLSVNSQFCNY
jgi:hypothetical protein